MNRFKRFVRHLFNDHVKFIREHHEALFILVFVIVVTTCSIIWFSPVVALAAGKDPNNFGDIVNARLIVGIVSIVLSTISGLILHSITESLCKWIWGAWQESAEKEKNEPQGSLNPDGNGLENITAEEFWSHNRALKEAVFILAKSIDERDKEGGNG